MEKEKEMNPDTTDALFMIGVPGSDEEAYEVIEAFKNIAENSPVLVREMNRLFLFSEAKILVCLQKHLSRCMMI